jgi:hypothetical protein
LRITFPKSPGEPGKKSRPVKFSFFLHVLHVPPVLNWANGRFRT